MFQPDHATLFAPVAGAGLLGLFGAAFSPLERTVIVLARNEADRGVASPAPARSAIVRRLTAIGRALVGSRPPGGLADERLEALRRFVALARRGDRHADRAAQMLRAHGYRPEQLAAIETLALA